jgi:hypothetical protein
MMTNDLSTDLQNAVVSHMVPAAHRNSATMQQRHYATLLARLAQTCGVVGYDPARAFETEVTSRRARGLSSAISDAEQSLELMEQFSREAARYHRVTGLDHPVPMVLDADAHRLMDNDELAESVVKVRARTAFIEASAKDAFLNAKPLKASEIEALASYANGRAYQKLEKETEALISTWRGSAYEHGERQAQITWAPYVWAEMGSHTHTLAVPEGFSQDSDDVRDLLVHVRQTAMQDNAKAAGDAPSFVLMKNKDYVVVGMLAAHGALDSEEGDAQYRDNQGFYAYVAKHPVFPDQIPLPNKKDFAPLFESYVQPCLEGKDATTEVTQFEASIDGMGADMIQSQPRSMEHRANRLVVFPVAEQMVAWIQAAKQRLKVFFVTHMNLEKIQSLLHTPSAGVDVATCAEVRRLQVKRYVEQIAAMTNLKALSQQAAKVTGRA